MSFATGTATTAEVVTFTIAAEKAIKAMQEIYSGECRPAEPKHNTPAEVDTLVAAVTTAITAFNA